MDKDKLKNEIEREFNQMVNTDIKEDLVDFIVLYVRKNKLPVDRESMSIVLEVMRNAFGDVYFKHVDHMLDRLDGKINDFVDNIDPLRPTGND